MTRTFLSAAIASIIMLCLGYVYWMVSPIPQKIMHRVTDETAVTQMIQQQMPETGFYVLPYAPEDITDPNFAGRYMDGPLATIFVKSTGANPMMTDSMILSLAFNFLTTLVLLSILRFLGVPRIYGKRVMAIFLLALFAVLALLPQYAVWFHFPWDFVLAEAGFALGGWLMVALVIAIIFDPSKMNISRR